MVLKGRNIPPTFDLNGEAASRCGFVAELRVESGTVDDVAAQGEVMPLALAEM